MHRFKIKRHKKNHPIHYTFSLASEIVLKINRIFIFKNHKCDQEVKYILHKQSLQRIFSLL